ncbi:WD40/YVTN/BNR-like repeat-containing protein, partial [Bacteroidota bacterium]
MFAVKANAQWINTGAEGGFHLSLGISSVNSNFVLAGGDIKGGIYRTVNAGAIWEYAGQRMQQFLCFAFDPQNQNTAFAGSSRGLFKSLDQGLTWNKVAFVDTMINSLQFNPVDPNILYVGTGSQAWDGSGFGIFKSTDGGSHFAGIGLVPNLITEILVSKTDTSKVLASCGSGVYLSTNSGSSWTLIGPTKDAVVGIPTSAISWNGADTMYACTFYQVGNYYQEGTIFRSINGGTSWDSLFAFKSNIEALKINPSNPNIVYAAVFESLTHKPGIWKSTDAGVTWQYKNNGIKDLMLKDIAIDPNNPSILYTTGDGGGGIYKTTDSGNNWSAINTGMTYFIGFQTKHFHVGTEDYIYSVNSLGVYKDIPQMARLNISTGIWEPSGIMTIDTTPYNQTMLSIFDIAQDPHNDYLMYSGGMAHSGGIHNYPYQGIFYSSSNGGISWQTPKYFDFRLVNTVEVVYTSTQQIILAGTGGKYEDSLYGVWKSLDGGLSFTQTNGWFPGVQITDIETDPFNTANIFAATTLGIFKSTDYGSNWFISPAWNGDSIKLTYRVLMDTTTNGRLFTANGGWLVNTDTTEYGGVSWSIDGWNTRFNGGFNHFNGTGLAMCGHLLFVGIGGQYVITAKDTIPGYGVWYTNLNQSVLSWQPLDTAGMDRKFVLSLACFDSVIYAGT